VVTRKKRLYTSYKTRIDGVDTVPELNSINSEIKSDREKERLTTIQLMLLKEQFDEKYMELREKELNYRLGKLPSKVEESVREIISDQIITEDEFEGMQKWLSRLRESKDFNADKKSKLQDVLKDWIDENMDSDWDIDK
jgi:hypothetical protein